jgi:GNAT superfamily N-acetyltransferase
VTSTHLIRAADPTEARAIAQLMRRTKAEAMPWLAVPHTLAEDEAWVANVLLPEHDVRVAVRPEESSSPVAVLALSPGWVEQLYVSTAEQGLGLGSRLLRLALDGAAEPVHLWTFQRNHRARAFYERHGFAEVRRTDGDNEAHEPDVLYRWAPGAA